MSIRMRPVIRTLSRAAVVFVASSVSGVRVGAQQFPQSSPTPARAIISREAVTALQLRMHPELSTAFMIVEALHANWMRERGVRPQPARRVVDGGRSVAGENGGAQVYLDGHRMGGTELLRNIPAKGIYAIRHLNGIQAQARFGAGHSEGVIWIATIPFWDRMP